MKVWELMRDLACMSAGAEVVLAHSSDSYRVPIVAVVREDDELTALVGDGLAIVTEDEETPQPKRKAVRRA